MVSLSVQPQYPPHVLVLGPREEAHMLRRLLQGGNLRITHLKALGSNAAAITLLAMQPDVLLVCCRSTNEVTLIRQLTSHLPLVIYSSIAEEAHIVRMLDAGADDYVLWGCGRGELQARLHRHIRRSWETRAPVGEISPSPGPLLLMESEDQHIRLLCEERCVLVRGQTVHLTPIEWALLLLLMREGGKVLSHVSLLQTVWGEQYREEVDYLRVHVSSLRLKLEADPKHPTYLETVIGVGYRFRQPCLQVQKGIATSAPLMP